MVVEPKRMPFSVETYERMVASGVLDEDLRVELIDGEIIEMPPLSPDHSIPVQRLAKLFIQALGDRAYVRTQDPIRLPPTSEPQPDVVLAVPPDTRYLSQHPGADDVLLVIEVARESRAFDRGPKLAIYARH